jgi:hypothetical protein
MARRVRCLRLRNSFLSPVLLHVLVSFSETRSLSHPALYAAAGFNKMGRDKTIGHVTNAFALVISMGSILLVVSLLGLFGAFCAGKRRFNEDGTLEIPSNWKRTSNRVLYAYFSIMMVTISCLMYGCLLCFVWSSKGICVCVVYVI